MIDVESTENKLTRVKVEFDAIINYDFLEEFKKIVDHHMEYLINFNAFPEIKDINKAIVYDAPEIYNGETVSYHETYLTIGVDQKSKRHIYFYTDFDGNRLSNNFEYLFPDSIPIVNFYKYNCINPQTDNDSLFVISFITDKEYTIVFDKNISMDNRAFSNILASKGLPFTGDLRLKYKLADVLINYIKNNAVRIDIPYEHGWKHPTKMLSANPANEVYWWDKHFPAFKDLEEQIVKEEK